MLKQRTLTALVLAPIAIAIILFLPTWAVALIISAVCLQATWEWTQLVGPFSLSSRIAFVVANALLLGLLWTIRNEPAAWYVIGAGLVGWLLALYWMRHFSYGAAPTREHTVLKLIACELAILPAWLAMMRLHDEPDRGHAWTLLAIVLIWTADTAAYFAGSRYGTTKLAPQISPNKTTAGAWGALLGAGVIAVIGGWLLDVRGAPLVALVALALVTVLASIAGDLFESLLKRQAGVKDSGTLFPGHGGLLDRVDALLAAMPVFVAGKALLDLAFAA
ncbi:phosphatidate cytidylyltransferase [Dokdonella sp.]|uniref:phosphatidate cytidylyltransferase n=1 Tax=Dokdonella sp. TaxID=2291710 RepID=UPI001B20ABDA|nr:phosphatidate cytidylyltransferase [Dokdonella sp.]MBO9662930.1 phosphatidate cytidylyltransferase [Dokdonella sp.]